MTSAEIPRDIIILKFEQNRFQRTFAVFVIISIIISFVEDSEEG